ncbi:TetR/AcrR family transcriptional regulator [Nocardia sp. JW2]|uniref:TetR/AcrR family transcriptional regulator n=1 Tax=Nocardia sp. JW2 TaxID=3450738 RepID=UPI003F42FE40
MITIDPTAYRSTHRQRQAARTATDLKAAARVVFARKGYLNTKITDITAEAGRAAGSFYNHFASKEEVLAALAVDIGEAADAIANNPPHPSMRTVPTIRESTRNHITVFWHTYAANRDVFAAIEQAALTNSAFAQEMRAYRTEQIQPWISWLDDLSARGARLPADPSTTAAMIAATAETMIQTWDGDLQTGIDNLTDFIAAGLGMGAGEH